MLNKKKLARYKIFCVFFALFYNIRNLSVYVSLSNSKYLYVCNKTRYTR